MFNNAQFKKVLAEMARGLMFSKGHISVNHPAPLIKPHGYDELMREVKQNCCCHSCC